MSINTFQRGETIGLWSYVRNWLGVYSTPDNGVKITLTNPKGVVKVDAQPMTESAAGKFVYYYLSQADDEPGYWYYECKSQDGTGGDAKYTITRGSFRLDQ